MTIITRLLTITFAIIIVNTSSMAQPWQHGNLRVCDNGRYLQHADGTPFFWLGNTAWLMPEKLTCEEVNYFLQRNADVGYNTVLVQTINDVPATNVYGELSHPKGWDMDLGPDEDGYWDHMDYIIDRAADYGIYVGMVCIWGGLVKGGKMDIDQAIAYGKFLANRYKDKPNIIWIIGGDIKGDVKPEVWEALATTIKAYDPTHLMTYHPFGRTSSAYWWHDAEWLDFNMFQSGHRRYDQIRGDGDDRNAASVAEDNWRYVEDGLRRMPAKPILDGEPSYEGIPQGLHDTTQPRWQAEDARRYAYWSVFAGSAGHTYGNNSQMQMMRVGDEPAYGATDTWQQALEAPGFHEMCHIKDLMLRFPYFDRIPDQSVILGDNGERYDRAIATRGNDYLMVYTYTNQPLTIDLTKITGKKKDVWWFSPTDGTYEYVGEYADGPLTIQHPGPTGPGHDWVLIAQSAEKSYLLQSQYRVKND